MKLMMSLRDLIDSAARFSVPGILKTWAVDFGNN